MSRVTAGTRGSQLALAQTDHVAGLLAAAHPGLEVHREIIHTTGDKILDTALSRIGDKGLFTKELESALLEGKVDLAVHSYKDVPTLVPDGLRIGAVLAREDPRDALVARDPSVRLATLPAGARVGTSSLRRSTQLRARRPDLQVVDLRGNVPTRLAKLDAGAYDAIVLAMAGLRRLGLADRVTEALDPDVILSAVSQGAVAVQVRSGDERLARLLAPLDHAPTRLAVAAERALLERLEGGCQVPIGALGRFTSDHLHLDGLVADLDGGRVVRARVSAEVASEAEAAELGRSLAERLLREGAGEILARVRDAAADGAP